MNFQPDIESCLKVLRDGGTILYPTDTIWGLGCDATNEVAVEKIFQVKQRPGNKALIVLLAEERDLLNYVAAPDPSVFDYLERLKKPTTIIYENAIHLADNLVANDGSVAIRVVKDEFCRQLIKRFRKPLVSTSANISGEKPPGNFKEISNRIKDAADYVVRYRNDETTPQAASALVKWNKDGSVTVIRP